MTDLLKLFQTLPKESISDIVRIHYEKDEDLLTADRDEQNEALVEDTIASGVDSLLTSIPKSYLEQIVTGLNLEYQEGKNQKNTAVMKKALYEAIDDKGVPEFFSKLTKDKLILFCKGAKLASTGDKTALQKTIEEEITTRGINAFFSQFSERELQQWCQDCELSAPITTSKKALIQALVEQKDLKPKKKAKSKISKTKVALEPGVTVADVFNWYTVKELKAYCTDKGLPTTGKLREIAKRVVDHLDGKEVKASSKNSATKKRKASTTKEKPEETKKRKKS
jgi:hypothetical protein